jgi:superfamily I DNA and/or RNA helicase
VPIAEQQDLGKGIVLWECEKDGNSYEVLYIPLDKKYEKILKRILQYEIKPLINRDITGIQKVSDTSLLENGDVLIVYESISDTSKDKPLETMRNIAIGLSELKLKENRQNFVISPKNIKKGKLQFIGLFDFFVKVDLLDKEYLAPNVKEWLEDAKKEKPQPNFQDDIYSLVKSFETELNEEILQKGLATERTKRFNKYSDLIDLLNGICLQYRKNLKVLTKDTPKEEFLQILEEMNKYCELCIELKKGEQEQIAVKFRTENWQGIFYVDDGRKYIARNYVFIPVQKCIQRRNFKTDLNWFEADFSFSLDKDSTFNSLTYFTEKFESINQLALLSKTKEETVEKWKTMPKIEKEFIEENALCIKYEGVKFKGTNAIFSLTSDSNNWETIKEHKKEETLLYAYYVTCDEIVEIKVGKIGEFRPTNKKLFIKDILCKEYEIAEKGELIEDIRQKVNQFKKQLKACQKFSKRIVVNPDICSILATPDNATIPSGKTLTYMDYEAFKEKVFNKNLLTDETQLKAVFEAISYKPIYLIQGPPGTGKTTVIVECIRQIIEREPNAKILVTSQSNLAVDNVLEKLVEISQNEEQNFKFMRLASESEGRDMNVTESIKPHTYEEKLKKWVNETIEENEKIMFSKFNKQENNKVLVDFYKATRNIEDINKFKEKLYKQPNNYIKEKFENSKTMISIRETFENIFGKEYLKLKDIQGEWYAFLNNTNTKNKKSKLNYGIEEIDFLTAMMTEMSIIGATCIHIANSKYEKINFKFDYVIMDESSKASPAETLVPVNMGRNIILIGDHKQLPPVVTREEAVKQKVKDELEDNGLDVEKEFGESLFEKLITAFETDESKQKHIKMLNVQYRMPKQIGSLISKFFYDGKLENPDEEIISDFDENKKHGLKLKKDTSIVFLSTSDRENPNDNGNKFKRENECNMKYIKEILEKLNELYADNLQKNKPFTIGIIAGYRGQVELLRKNIRTEQYSNFVQIDENNNKNYLIEINTVDKFQGAERDIIIYDIVRSDKGQSNIGFLDDYRRINVAFSRVKRLLVVVGDSEYLIKRATLNPGGKFTEFKLQQIAKELQEQGLVFNNFEEIF